MVLKVTYFDPRHTTSFYSLMVQYTWQSFSSQWFWHLVKNLEFLLIQLAKNCVCHLVYWPHQIKKNGWEKNKFCVNWSLWSSCLSLKTLKFFQFFKECSTKMVQPQFMSGLKFYILLLTFSLRLSLKVNELSDDHRNRHTALCANQPGRPLS